MNRRERRERVAVHAVDDALVSRRLGGRRGLDGDISDPNVPAAGPVNSTHPSLIAG
jgi:hypothetical protein